MVGLERKVGASFRMDPQVQQEAGGVWLEGKTRVSFRMELQGQEDAGARVVSEACIASVDSVVKWPELLEWLEWPDEFSICVARGLLSAWPGVFYWREDQGGHRGGEDGKAGRLGKI